MVKTQDLKLTLKYFEDSETWDYGEYKLLSSDIRNFGARKADNTIDLGVAQRILDVNAAKALGHIKKDLDTNRILTIFSWADLAGSRFIDALPIVMEAQLSGMITDGNKEIKRSSSYSGQGVDTQSDITGNLISGDRLYREAEDRWIEYQLDKYTWEYDEDANTYSLIDNADATIKKIVAVIELTQAQKDELTFTLKNDPEFIAKTKGQDGAPGAPGVPGAPGTPGQNGPAWLSDNYADLQDFIDNAPNNAKVKYNINKDGTNNVKGYTELVKVGANVVQIITKEEIDLLLDAIEILLNKKVQITSEGANLPNGVTLSYNLVKGSDGNVYALVPFMTEAEWIKNVNDTMAAKDQADANKREIQSLKAQGKYIGTYTGTNAADLSNFPATRADGSPLKEDDRGVLKYPSGNPGEFAYQEFIRFSDAWIALGEAHSNHPHSGITLNDVATQQDPKIATAKQEAITEAKKYTDEEIAKHSGGTWKELVGDEITNFNDDTKLKVRLTIDGVPNPAVLLISKVWNDDLAKEEWIGIWPPKLSNSGWVTPFPLMIYDFTTNKIIRFQDSGDIQVKAPTTKVEVI